MLLAVLLVRTAASGVGPAILLVLGCLALVPASDLVIALVNRGLAILLPPSVLPRLDLREGVPSTLRTLVVVPTLLTDPVQAAAQIEGLEVHYLSNPDGDLRFAILSDWTDAPAECMPGTTTPSPPRARPWHASTDITAEHWAAATASSLPSPAALECRRADVDGLGA